MTGKDKCEFLKGVRKRIAEANGIPYEPRECTFEGECTGTCPFCEKEAAELMAELKKREAEGAEIKTDEVGIVEIQLGRAECAETDEEENGYKLFGSLVNVNDEPVDPFNGPNNPLMTKKKIEEFERLIHEQKKPLMGDINDEEWRKTKKEEWCLQQEEEIRRVMEEQETPLEGYVLPYEKLSKEEKEALRLMEEMEERERKEKKMGIVRKLMNIIKSKFEPPLQGLIEEE